MTTPTGDQPMRRPARPRRFVPEGGTSVGGDTAVVSMRSGVYGRRRRPGARAGRRTIARRDPARAPGGPAARGDRPRGVRVGDDDLGTAGTRRARDPRATGPPTSAGQRAAAGRPPGARPAAIATLARLGDHGGRPPGPARRAGRACRRARRASAPSVGAGSTPPRTSSPRTSGPVGWQVHEDAFTTPAFVDRRRFERRRRRPDVRDRRRRAARSSRPAATSAGRSSRIDWDAPGGRRAAAAATAGYGGLPAGAIVLVRAGWLLPSPAGPVGPGGRRRGLPRRLSGGRGRRGPPPDPDPSGPAHDPGGRRRRGRSATRCAAAAAAGHRPLVTNATTEPAATRSIIAELPGSEPGLVVMLGAHLDSVVDGPGINDNGSGVAALLELARALGGSQPRATIRLGVLERRGARPPRLVALRRRPVRTRSATPSSSTSTRTWSPRRTGSPACTTSADPPSSDGRPRPAVGGRDARRRDPGHGRRRRRVRPRPRSARPGSRPAASSRGQASRSRTRRPPRRARPPASPPIRATTRPATTDPTSMSTWRASSRPRWRTSPCRSRTTRRWWRRRPQSRALTAPAASVVFDGDDERIDCPRCGGSVPPTSFCVRCGEDLRDDRPTAATHRGGSYAAAPGEAVARVALFSTLLPQLAGRRPRRLPHRLRWRPGRALRVGRHRRLPGRARRGGRAGAGARAHLRLFGRCLRGHAAAGHRADDGLGRGLRGSSSASPSTR